MFYLNGDGQPIDVYVVGINEPLNEFEGQVKAVIIRYNDHENKLVVTGAGEEIDEERIIQMTYFQEKFFDIEIRMLEM